MNSKSNSLSFFSSFEMDLSKEIECELLEPEISNTPSQLGLGNN